MIATIDTTRERRRHAARRAWADPMRRARILAGQLIASERRRVARIVEGNLSLLDRAAAHFAARYPGLDFEDARQAAYPGLVRAAETFDPTRGATFSTWSYNWCRSAITEALPNLRGVVRIPKRAAFPRPVVSSFDAADHDDAAAPEPDDDGATCPIAAACRAEDRERVHLALGKLHPRDALVAELRFGINGAGRPHTLAEIAERLGGVTPERVRQIEARALSKLRAALADE